MRDKVSCPFALREYVDEVVEDKQNAVYQAEVGVHGFERVRHTMVEKIWPFLWEGARDLRSATKERGIRVPGPGETHAHLCNEDVEKFLRYLHGSAFSLVSN